MTSSHTKKRLVAMFCKILFILIAVASEFSSIVSGVYADNITLTSADCLVALAAAFSTYNDIEKFSKLFNNDSIVEIATVGSYHGASEILEYFTFLNYHIYHDSSILQDICPFLPPMVSDDNECVITTACRNRIQYNKKIIGKEVCSDDMVGFKIFYNITGKVAIRRMNIYIPGDKFIDLFGNTLNGDGVRDNICRIIMSECKEMASLNNIKTKEDCGSKFDALPTTQGDGYIDQNSKGCRILHAAFADSNQNHCPHLSFVPQKDYKGNIKCQDGNGLIHSDLFLDTDINFFEKTALNLGYSDKTFSKRCTYDSDSSTVKSGAQVLLLSWFVYSIAGATVYFLC